MKWRLGGAEAVTATAHKLARIIYHLLSTKQPYNESLFVQCDRQEGTRAEMRLRKQAMNLGYAVAHTRNIVNFSFVYQESAFRRQSRFVNPG